MDTDLVLDLFKCTTEEEDAAAAAAARREKEREKGGTSQKSVLAGLEDLPPDEEYEGLDLQSFLASH